MSARVPPTGVTPLSPWDVKSACRGKRAGPSMSSYDMALDAMDSWLATGGAIDAPDRLPAGSMFNLWGATALSETER